MKSEATSVGSASGEQETPVGIQAAPNNLTAERRRSLMTVLQRPLAGERVTAVEVVRLEGGGGGRERRIV